MTGVQTCALPISLRRLNDRLTSKGTLKRYDKILEKIGRLKQRYQVGHLYKITIARENNRCTRIDFHLNPSAVEQHPPGQYVLRTNRLDLSARDISRIHRSLTCVEDSFRSMKGHLGLRPNFHHSDDPTIAHIFITVLAYHVLAFILTKLRSAGITSNWTSIRSILSTHVRLTTSLKTDSGASIHIRSNSRPDQQQSLIYNALSAVHNPIGSIKSTLPNKCSDENPPPKKITN